MDENETLVIYFENGKTSIFEQATNVKIEENNTMNFNYIDTQSKEKRWAVFMCDCIAGFSVKEDED